MKREFDQLRGGPFDLLVVGGGVYGAWTAYDAALRGLRVALVERDDWASGTSAASSKLIHGGLRYLEHGELGLVRKTLDERRRLARLGPHRIRPLRFLMPVYRGDRVGRFRLRVGLLFYDLLAGGGQPVPPHRALGSRELLELIDIEPTGLRGGFAFGDCRTDDARLVVEIVDGAFHAGAVSVNRAAARELIVEGGRAAGAVIEDREGGQTLEVRALATVVSAGPWVGGLAASAGIPGAVTPRLTKGIHLILPSLGIDDAFVISSNDDARIVFLIPWYGRTLFGTTDTDYDGEPADVRVEPRDVAYLLERLHRVVRGARWSESDVIASFAGLRTLPATDDRDPSSVTREWIVTEPLEGLYVPIGGKLTSARADAAGLVDRVVRRAGWTPRRSPTADRPFPWCPLPPFDDWLDRTIGEAARLGLDEETARSCALRFGSRTERIFERIRATPDLARRILPDAPFCRAEIDHAVDEEMARSLEDLLRRRVPLLLTSRVNEDTLQQVARIAGERLGWDEKRRRAEIEQMCGSVREAPVR